MGNVRSAFIANPYSEQTNKNLRCGNRKGLLSRNDQTHHRMGPKTMESIPPSKRNNKQTNKNLRCGNRKGLLGPSRHPTTDTANSSTSKQITSRRLIGVSKSNTIQSTNQAGCPVSPPHMYHPRRPAHQPVTHTTSSLTYMDNNNKQTNKNLRCGNRKGQQTFKVRTHELTLRSPRTHINLMHPPATNSIWTH